MILQALVKYYEKRIQICSYIGDIQVEVCVIWD